MGKGTIYKIAFIDTQNSLTVFVNYTVDEAVSRYIKQLEMYIKHPDESRLLDVHKHLTPTGRKLDHEY